METQTDKSILDLATAHMTQHTNGHIKSDWSIEKNITDEVIIKFDKTYNEKQMFKILDFAKEYELIAFNKGIKFGKEKTITVYEEKLKVSQMQINLMSAENDRLSKLLDKLSLGTEDTEEDDAKFGIPAHML